jgi:small multidrug resistance pump
VSPAVACAWLGLAIVAEVAGTAALKLSEGFTRLIPSVVVIAGYLFAFWAESQSLRALPLGLVYATWSGAGTVGAVILGRLVFGESMGIAQLAGVAFVVSGVALLNVPSGGPG